MKSFKILSCRDGKTLRSAESQALTAHGSNCPIYPYFWTRGDLDCSFKIEIVMLLFVIMENILFSLVWSKDEFDQNAIKWSEIQMFMFPITTKMKQGRISQSGRV